MSWLVFGALACFFYSSHIAVGVIAWVVLVLPYLVILPIGAGLPWLLGPVFPGANWTFGGHPICWFTLLVTLYLKFSISHVLNACAESVKATCFTIFQTTIMHDDQIHEDNRGQPLHPQAHRGLSAAVAKPDF
jgi:hypothetical protein